MLSAKKYPDFWMEDHLGWYGSWVFLGSEHSQRLNFAVPFTRYLADKTLLDAKGRNLVWPSNQTELRRIGSYTRSCRIIKDPIRIEKLYEEIRKYNPNF